MKERGRTILQKDRFKITVYRLCHQIIENYPDISNLCIIGVQPRGTFLSNRIYQVLSNMFPDVKINYGKLDITFHRDDFRIRSKPIQANNTEIDFLVEDRNVILIDDVLYTGRTIHIMADLKKLNYLH
jgi:pyrimidine operon attenuation protein/uracil phosphoribosyltransferase